MTSLPPSVRVIRFVIAPESHTFQTIISLQADLRVCRRTLRRRERRGRVCNRVQGALLLLGAALLDVDPQGAIEYARAALRNAHQVLRPTLRGNARRSFVLSPYIRVFAHQRVYRRFLSRRRFISFALRNIGSCDLDLHGVHCTNSIIPLPLVLPATPWWYPRRAEVQIEIELQDADDEIPTVSWILQYP